MRYAALLSIVLAATGCGFAQKHPAATIGITAGVIGFGACGMAVEKLDTCSLIGGAAGLGLGGIAGLAMLFADTDEHALPPLEEEDGVIREGTPPPPGLPPDAAMGEPVPSQPPAAPSQTQPAPTQTQPAPTQPPATPSQTQPTPTSPTPTAPPMSVPSDAGVAPLAPDAGLR